MRSNYSYGRRTFSGGNAICQDDNAPIQKVIIFSECHEERSSEVDHISGHQSPNLKIIENLWYILEIQVRS